MNCTIDSFFFDKAKPYNTHYIFEHWVPKKYEALFAEHMAALNQAAYGKGLERHANDNDFTAQPIIRIGEMVGLGYPIGQAMKKAQEAIRLLETKGPAAAKAELHGAINYLASASMLIEPLPSPFTMREDYDKLLKAEMGPREKKTPLEHIHPGDTLLENIMEMSNEEQEANISIQEA